MLEQLFRELYKNEIDRDNYINSIPMDIRTSYFDNTFASNLLNEREHLLKIIFGDFYDSVMWFIYEWRPGFEVGMNDVMTQIHSIDQYISWMQENEGFPKD